MFSFASTIALFGSLAAFSEVKFRFKNQNLALVIPPCMPTEKTLLPQLSCLYSVADIC